jgi:hypothetical protein
MMMEGMPKSAGPSTDSSCNSVEASAGDSANVVSYTE